MIAVLLVTRAVGAFFVVTYSRFITHILIPAIRRRFQRRRFLTSNNDVESESTVVVGGSHAHTTGLEKSVINTIPMFIYAKSKQVENCAVCLDI